MLKKYLQRRLPHGDQNINKRTKKQYIHKECRCVMRDNNQRKSSNNRTDVYVSETSSTR